jgi:hypothetical protein
MKCQMCSKEFSSKRSDAKFCSPACRVAFSRVVTDNSVTDKVDIPVTDKVPLTPDQEYRVIYLQQLCGISKEQATQTVLENDKE